MNNPAYNPPSAEAAKAVRIIADELLPRLRAADVDPAATLYAAARLLGHVASTLARPGELETALDTAFKIARLIAAADMDDQSPHLAGNA